MLWTSNLKSDPVRGPQSSSSASLAQEAHGKQHAKAACKLRDPIFFKIFVVQILYKLVCTAQSARHEFNSWCFLHPVIAIFSTGIQPVLKLRKNLQQQANQNFFLCSQCCIWMKSYVKWFWLFYWKIIFPLDMSRHMTRYLFFQWLHCLGKVSKQNLPKYKMRWSRNSKVYNVTFSKVHINLKLI